jgi:hypothetical protein
MGSAPPASSTRESSSLTALSTATTSQRMRTFCISQVCEQSTETGLDPAGLKVWSAQHWLALFTSSSSIVKGNLPGSR